MPLLKFSPPNAKTRKLGNVYSLDLPAGHTCLFADKCKSKVINVNGTFRIKDGPNTQFRCFSASQEVIFKNVRESRWYNYRLLKGKSTKQIVNLIIHSLPDTNIIRYHVGGDFFNQSYFDAAIQVALLKPDIKFYAYTKALKFWIKRLNIIPNNFILTASYGGKLDHLIKQYRLPSAKVVFDTNTKLRIDIDDSIASTHKIKHFALLLHGPQPAKTKASRAWQKLKVKDALTLPVRGYFK
jgi:hypothetical protein